MASIETSARTYEDWLRRQLGPDFVEADLVRKHDKMRSGPFPFLRGTYWRWAETILEICPELGDAPEVLAIGDTHLENFGAWRDAEGRLAWGVNDFDETATMPYALDLVRLATSALLARADLARPGGGTSATDICAAILAGYRAGIDAPGGIVLDRDHKWLRKTILLPERQRTRFWEKLDLPPAAAIPGSYKAALCAAMPEPGLAVVLSPRTAGIGSLGRPRFVGRTAWRGGPVVREAKAILTSAWSHRHAPGDTAIRAGEIAAGRFRAVDPHYRVADGIIVRRLSPNSHKIEVKDAADKLLAPRMLRLMGCDIANCHANDLDRLPALKADLTRRGAGWLREAARQAARHVEQEQRTFARAGRAPA
jgi:hypothetical protein